MGIRRDVRVQDNPVLVELWVFWDEDGWAEHGHSPLLQKEFVFMLSPTHEFKYGHNREGTLPQCRL